MIFQMEKAVKMSKLCSKSQCHGPLCTSADRPVLSPPAHRSSEDIRANTSTAQRGAGGTSRWQNWLHSCHNFSSATRTAPWAPTFPGGWLSSFPFASQTVWSPSKATVLKGRHHFPSVFPLLVGSEGHHQGKGISDILGVCFFWVCEI